MPYVNIEEPVFTQGQSVSLRVDLGILLTDYQDPYFDGNKATSNQTSAPHEALGPGQLAPKTGAQRYNAPLPGFSSRARTFDISQSDCQIGVCLDRRLNLADEDEQKWR